MPRYPISAKDSMTHPAILQLPFIPFTVLYSQFVTKSYQFCFQNTSLICPSPFSGISSHHVLPCEYLHEITCTDQSLCHLPVSCPHSKSHLLCQLYLSPVYNLSVPPTSYISGNKSKFCTRKPFIVHQSPLPLCSTTCGDPRNKDPCPDVPTSSRVFCLKCPTSSSVFPQTALSSNANLWLSLWIHTKIRKIKLANQCQSPLIFGNVNNTLWVSPQTRPSPRSLLWLLNVGESYNLLSKLGDFEGQRWCY